MPHNTTMKTKTRFHAQAVEILNKPGRYGVLRQWTAGGATMHDAGNGDGYTLEEATAFASQHNALNNAPRSVCASGNCRSL